MSADSESFPPPNDPDEFESLCLDLWIEIWHDPNAQKNGRSGQPQAGVDLYGQQDGKWIGVQCKQKNGLLRSKVTVPELEREVGQAMTFKPALSSFVLATTGPADAELQQRARELTDKHRDRGLFLVEVWSWERIWHEVYGREELLRRIGPVYWPRTWRLIEERLNTSIRFLRDPEGEREFCRRFAEFAVNRPAGEYRDRCGLGPLSFPPSEDAYSDSVIAELTTKRGLVAERFVREGGTARFILTRTTMRDEDLKVHTPLQLASRYRALLQRLTEFRETSFLQAVAAPRAEGFSEAILDGCLLIRAFKYPEPTQFYKTTEFIALPSWVQSQTVLFDEDFDALRGNRTYRACKEEIIEHLRRNLGALGF